MKQSEGGKHQYGPLHFKGEKKKLHEREDILKTTTIMDTFTEKRYGKGLLVQIKEDEVYKILTNKEFTDETDNPFEKVVPHKKFYTW